MNIRQYAFVTAYLKHRDAIIAYKLATGSESTNLRSLQSAANRMLNKPGVREEIESVLKATRSEVEAEIAETTRTELMTIQRKREILAMIINGQYTVMVRAKGKNCNPCTYFNSPTISQVLAGIREDNKMAGHYAVVTTKSSKKMQHPSGSKREVATTPSEEKVPCLGDLGVPLAPDTRELQQITTTDLEETPNNASPPVRTARPGGLQGDRGTLEPEEKTQQSATELCPPPAGVSRSDGGACLSGRQGIPEPKDEMQQSATTTESPSSAAEASAKEAPPAEAPAKAVNLKKLLTETTRLAQAPIPATLRPFFEAYETHSE